jgi:PPE-repeat protein
VGTHHNRSWEDLTETLRTAAAEVRSALGRAGSPSSGDDAAAARLKGDVSRLERTASDLISAISSGLRERGSEIGSSFDRERAQRSAEQMKTSLEDLAALAVNTASEVGSAANSTLKHAEPELKHVARALETVAESATAWIRTTIDPEKKQPGSQASKDRQPLDDL